MNTRRLSKIAVHCAAACSVLFVVSCGGGGSSAPTPTPTSSPAPTPTPTPTPTPPPTSSGPTWEEGVFASSEDFVAQCAAPRSGIDEFSGEPFSDTEGSEFLEKMWLRSWTYETYLWFEEVPDNDPDDFSVAAYFDQLKTPEVTPSGRPKDNFHFTENTESYNTRTQSGVSSFSGYGISWVAFSRSPPREFIVRYSEPGSSAGNAGVPRGASLVSVNGIDFVNSNSDSDIDSINAALFPDENGSVNEFGFVTADGAPIEVTLTSENVNLVPVQNVRVIDTDVGRVGYMQFNSFISPSQEDLIDAFRQFETAGINELVLDLRYNGGGSLTLASQIAYMVAGPSQTNNRIFENIIDNGKFGSGAEIPFYDREIDYDEFVFVTPTRILPSPEMTRVFVLSTPGTCSASESLINGLRGIDVEVVLIGNTTCGKPFGFFPTDNCGTTYFSIQIQSTNEKGFGDYQDGFRPLASPVFDDELPGCSVPDDLTQALGSESEALFAAALQYMADGTCPVANVQGTLAEQSFELLGTREEAIRVTRESQRREIILNAIANETRERISEPNQ